MACCFRPESDDVNYKNDKDITNQIRKEQRDKTKIKAIKLLLLGAGDSGKSTIAKQMKILFQDGYTEEERKHYIPAIHANVLNSIKDLLRGIQKYGVELSATTKDIAQSILSFPPTDPLNKEIVSKIRLLCTDTQIDQILKKSSDLQVYDHLDYMIKRMDEFIQPSFVPLDDDILRVRVKTTGIMELTYTIEHTSFTYDIKVVNRVVDMGGQRSERHSTVNRMQESLDLFKQIINNRYFQNTPIIFFMNKQDLFKDKITRSDLRQCFPEYTGASEYKPAVAFIQQKFLEFNMNSKRQIFTHETCATDTQMVKKVLDDVRLTLLKQGLEEIGML